MKKVKILKQTAVALMIAAISFTGCKKDDPVKVSGISLNKTTLTLGIGGSETLTATITPADAENKVVTWTSDKPDVATVTDGKVTAVKAGTATITVTTTDGGKTATCAVTVQATFDPANAMTITTAISGQTEITLAGTGTAIIDWGDGSTHETVNLSAGLIKYPHTFSGTTSRTIAIDGQNITHLRCDELQVTALDVSKNTELTYLSCYQNSLTNLDITKNIELTFLDCSDNLFTADGLNALFGTLHNNPGYKSINIQDNPGFDDCDRTIATVKGWTEYVN